LKQPPSFEATVALLSPLSEATLCGLMMQIVSSQLQLASLQVTAALRLQSQSLFHACCLQKPIQLRETRMRWPKITLKVGKADRANELF